MIAFISCMQNHGMVFLLGVLMCVECGECEYVLIIYDRSSERPVNRNNSRKR